MPVTHKIIRNLIQNKSYTLQISIYYYANNNSLAFFFYPLALSKGLNFSKACSKTAFASSIVP